MRHGAQRRFTPPGQASRVDEFAEALADLEEGHPLLGYVDGAAGFRITSLARIPVADTEAAEATKIEMRRLGGITFGGTRIPASCAAPLTASSRPPSSSIIWSALA